MMSMEYCTVKEHNRGLLRYLFDYELVVDEPENTKQLFQAGVKPFIRTDY